MYSPSWCPLMVRVWVYLAVTGSTSTLDVLSLLVSRVESKIHSTLVAGPPVEIHVRVN